MLPTSRYFARLLDWLIILLMLLFSSVSIGVFFISAGVMGQPASSESQVDWLHVLYFAAATAWSATPLIASFLALKSRKAAGWFWFLGAFPVWVATALVLNAGGGWAREFWVMVAVAAILLAIGSYWLSASAHQWPPLLAPSEKFSLARVLCFITTVALVCILGLITAVIRWEAPEDIGDCSGFYPPYAKPLWPSQAVFVAQDLIIFGPAPSPDDLSPSPFGDFAIVRVQEHFWGLEGWSQKFLLIYRPFYFHGQSYLISGGRPTGFLTRHLPLLKTTKCGGARLVSDAGPELKLLRERQPQKGARIIGQLKTLYGYSEKGVLQAGFNVTITGPAGSLVATTDANGVYDFPGLPPGSYTIEGGSPPRAVALVGFCASPLQLAADEIAECDIQAPTLPK
jgi:hypothetical protein